MDVSSTQPEPQPTHLRPEVQRIITAGQKPTTERAGSGKSAVLLTSVSLVLLWLSFTPADFYPLAWIALVPLCQLLRLRSLPPWCLTLTWTVGFVWSVATLQWMRLGHPAMYLALAAISVYIALYIPLFIWISRRCIAQGLPIWLAVPIVWTALEFARAYVLTGFSWYYLGHTQYRWLHLIQICDLVGAYGVTFVVALVSGAITEHVPLAWLKRLNLDVPDSTSQRASIAPVVIAGFVVVACCGYGAYRKTPSNEFAAGPVFALIQGNFTPEIKHDQDTVLTRFRVHDALTRYAVGLQPDFLVWPETMFPWPDQSVAEGVTDDDILSQFPAEVVRSYGNEAAMLVEPFRNHDVQKRLASDSKASGAALLIGLEAMVAEKDDLRIYNAAAFARPDLGYIGRYDKQHRVVFGEYVPLADIFPWLSNLTPYGTGFGIDAGSDVRLFEYAGVRIAPMICFEDTVPHVVREMAAQRDSEGRGCDVLVNLTNDAWFRGSSELDQHLITSAFRAVESRMPLVRCVNGGISAFVDGNGQICEPDQILIMSEPLEGLTPQLTEVKSMRDPKTGSWLRQFSGIILGQVPLDHRESLYVRYGDWFATLCSLVAVAFFAKSFVRPH